MYPPPPPPVAPVEKKKKIFELLGAYSQHITVFALILAVLWYYAKFTTFPYFGNGAGYVSAFGSVALAIGASGVFGVVKHVVD